MTAKTDANETTRCQTYTEYPSGGPAARNGPTSQDQEGQEEIGEEDEEVPCLGLCGFPVCGRFRFPYLFIASLVQFSVYLNKIYQDSNAAKTYYNSKDVAFFVISLVSLVIPSIMFIVYSVGTRLMTPPQDGGNRTKCTDAFTGFINGLLLVPWQIKSRAEVLHFCAQRICARRAPTRQENKTVNTLRRRASVLEFFEEFYAGMLQLLLQLYLMLLVLEKGEVGNMLIGEVIGSSLALIAAVKAISRKDDGPLTGWLSRLGWLSLFTTRCLALALAAQVLHAWTVLICAAHVLAMTVWISRLAWESHLTVLSNANVVTPALTGRRRAGIFILILCLFGLPSLVYWPVMFQLKERHRPFIFLVISGVENCAFFAIWFFGGSRHRTPVSEWTTTDLCFVGLLFGSLLLGSLCLALYVMCKPKYTDQVVMHDMKVLNENSYGIYYDFYDATFKLPSSDRLTDNLRKIRAAATRS